MTASASGGDPKYGLASPAHRPLAGRNCLLGDLLEATFTSVIALSADQAVICSDAGDVCLLDDSEKTARVSKLFSLGVGITAASAGADGLVYVTDVHANTHVFRIDENMSVFPTSADESQENGHATKHATHVVAMGYLGDSVVTLDSKHGIQLRSVPSLDDDDPQPKVLYRLPAHEDAVLGVRALPQPNDLGAEILSWSAGGTVILWDAACQPTAAVQVPLEQSDDAYHAVNELKTVIHLQKTLILAGDKYGVLRVLDARTNEASCIIRAHSADITDLAVHADTRNCFVASSGRDRTAQLFRWGDGRLELLQTLDEHAGAVTTVLFAKNGDQLLSCSTDRSIVVREVLDMGADKSVAYVITRTIALKSAPTSMRTSLYEDMLLVSTSDKYVQLVNTSSGRIMQSFKTADAEGGDAVIMSCIVHLPSAAGPPIIAGVASSDKSIRLYSEDGTLLARDWGHTEGVTSIALVQNSTATSQSSQTQPSDLRLVSAAADGTIFIWDTSTPRRSPFDPSKSFDSPIPQPLSGSLGPPLRKVISMTEIARFTQSRSGEDSEPSSPTALKSPMSPTLRKKMSRLSISRAPKLEPSPSINGLRQRSPSPPSPLRKTQAQETSGRRQSIGPGSPLSRNSAAINGVEEDHGAKGSTEQLCRTLRAYRKGTTSYIADVPASALAELERELRLTLQLAKKGQDMPTKEPASPAKRSSVRHDTSNENSKPNTPLKTNRLSEKLQQGNEDTKERPGAGTHGMSNDEKMEADATTGAEAMGQGVQS
ncbi:hypothetical protein M8818_006454 [Zalaria obscura]|uniref:Uncharacterized protein n=1 Tax=Zalaria obscura TaxID=2024903 RepID=A0ACC3S5S6_9PEZI